MTVRIVSPAGATGTPHGRPAAALAGIVARLLELHPEARGRVERGARLAITGKVTTDAGRWLVTGSQGTTYVVDPITRECSCPDATGRGLVCKHTYSVLVWKQLTAVERSAPPVEPQECSRKTCHRPATPGMRLCATCRALVSDVAA